MAEGHQDGGTGGGEVGVGVHRDLQQGARGTVGHPGDHADIDRLGFRPFVGAGVGGVGVHRTAVEDAQPLELVVVVALVVLVEDRRGEEPHAAQ